MNYICIYFQGKLKTRLFEKEEKAGNNYVKIRQTRRKAPLQNRRNGIFVLLLLVLVVALILLLSLLLLTLLSVAILLEHLY